MTSAPFRERDPCRLLAHVPDGADGSDANAWRAMSQAVCTRLTSCFWRVRSLGFGVGWIGLQSRFTTTTPFRPPKATHPSAHLVRPYDGFIFGNGPLGLLPLARHQPSWEDWASCGMIQKTSGLRWQGGLGGQTSCRPEACITVPERDLRM